MRILVEGYYFIAVTEGVFDKEVCEHILENFSTTALEYPDVYYEKIQNYIPEHTGEDRRNINILVFLKGCNSECKVCTLSIKKANGLPENINPKTGSVVAFDINMDSGINFNECQLSFMQTCTKDKTFNLVEHISSKKLSDQSFHG